MRRPGWLSGMCWSICSAQASASIDRAGKLDQGAIASELYEPATVAGECRLQTLLAVFLQARQRAAFVPTHEAGVADNVGSQPLDCAAHGSRELPCVAGADRKGPGPPRPLRVKRVGFVMSAVCPVYPKQADIFGLGRQFAFGPLADVAFGQVHRDCPASARIHRSDRPQLSPLQGRKRT
jgi:hypothetical protein